MAIPYCSSDTTTGGIGGFVESKLKRIIITYCFIKDTEVIYLFLSFVRELTFQNL